MWNVALILDVCKEIKDVPYFLKLNSYEQADIRLEAYIRETL